MDYIQTAISQIVKKTRGKNLFFSEDIEESIDKAEIIFMAVNTPTKTEGDGAGMAADLRLGNRSVSQIASAAKACKSGGVGSYPRSGFVHIDCGPVRAWKK